MRPPACPPGHELEVDREGVEPEPEQRVRVERLRDEVVHLEVERGRRVARLQAGMEHVLEVREPPRDHEREHRTDGRERDEQRARGNLPPVDDREHGAAYGQPEQAAPRERPDLGQHEKPEQHRERDAQAMALLQPEVDRCEQEQRHDEHHAKVVRVAGERIDPIHVRRADGAPDVDRRRAARDRVQDERIEIVPGHSRGQLEHAVDRVRREPGAKPSDRPPVEALGPPREVRNPCRQEGEVDRELRHSFLEERQRLFRVEVEEPDEVDEQQAGGEGEHRDGRGRNSAVARGEPIGQERDDEKERQHVGEVHPPGHVPVHVLEGD